MCVCESRSDPRVGETGPIGVSNEGSEESLGTDVPWSNFCRKDRLVVFRRDDLSFVVDTAPV